MNEEMMTTGFTGADAAEGPNAGYDPVMKFRKKLKKTKDDKKLVCLVINLVSQKRIQQNLLNCINIKLIFLKLVRL